MGHFLHLQKEALTIDKKGAHEIRKWEKEHQSDFDRGIYETWTGAFMKRDRSLIIRKEKGHVSLLKLNY